MHPREARLAPSPLRRALLLLVPLALLVTALLGLLAQSASADHAVDPPSGLTVAPGPVGSDTTPSWSFTLPESTDTATCRLDGPNGVVVPQGTCTSPFTSPVLSGDGTYTFSVATVRTEYTTTDSSATPTTTIHAGGTSEAVTSTYVLDTTAPAVSVTGPTGAAYTGWAVSTTDATTVTRTCTLTGPATASGPGPSTVLDGSTCNAGTVKPALVADGSYTLSVTATDQVGLSTTGTSAPFLYDGTAPVVSVADVPTGRDTTPTWSFSTGDATTVSCTLTGPGVSGPVACSGTSFTSAELTTSGTYVLEVTGVDAAGNRGFDTGSYVLDRTGPTVTLSPAGDTRGTADSQTWTVSTDGTLTRCVVGGVVVTCAAELTGTRTTDGTITLEVTAEDEFGNPTTATASYTRDTGVSFTVTAPTGPTSNRTPTWTFTAGEPVTFVSCVLEADGRAVTNPGGTCGPDGYTPNELPLTDGTSYVLVVTVRDALLNELVVRSSPAYLLDTTASPLTLQPAPGQTAVDDSTQPSWTFVGDTWSNPTCRFTVTGESTDLGGTCSTTGFTAPVLTQPSGTQYTLTVTVTDSAGNLATQVTTYELDTTAPAATATAPTPAADDDQTPTFTFTFEPGATVTCALTGSARGSITGGTCTVDAAAGTGSYTAPDLGSTAAETFTFTLGVTDGAGNPSTASASYLLDTVDPAVTASAPSPAVHDDQTPAFTFTFEPGATVTCALVGSVRGAVTGGTCTVNTAAGTGSYTAPDLGVSSGETFTFTVSATDGATNTATADAAYVLDTVDPAVAATSPAARGNDQTPTFTFTFEPGATVTCALSGSVRGAVSGGTCAVDRAGGKGSYTAPDLGTTTGETFTFTVAATDAAANTATSSTTYLLDTVAELTVTPPASPSNDTTPTWTLTPEAGATASCALVGPGAPASGIDCSTGAFTPPALPGTAGADYVLTVTVTDALGNVTTYVQPTFHLDTQLPVATITVPNSPSRQTSVTWTVAVDEALTSASCQLRKDGTFLLALASCPGSTTVSLPGDGRYDLVVTLVDLAGNTSTTTSTVLVHDATVPTAPVLSPTSSTSNRTTAVWTVTGESGTAVTTCRVTRGSTVVQDWTVCTGTFSVPLPGDGEYLLEAVSTDPVGPGATSSATYLLDTVLPVAPTVTGPTGPAQSRTPSWTVGAEPGTTTECRLVRGSTVVSDWAPCSGGFTAALDGLPDGGYVLESRATDAARNVGPVGSSVTYVLDTTAPLAPGVTGPAGPSQLRNPGFTWTGEAGTRSECQLSRDGVVVGDWVACTPGYAPTLSQDGTWTLAVRLTDAAGNVSDVATTGGYVLDTTPPAIPVVTPPKTPGRDLAPSWGAVVEGGTTLECRLTGADGVVTAWAACTLPLSTSLAGRPDGPYVLEVRATDQAGNLSAVGKGTYVLDTVAPTAAVITSPPGGRSRTPSFTYTVEPGATTRCRLTSGSTLISDFAACATPVALDLTGLPDGTYTLTVRVVDAAGNPGPAATGTYVLDTTGPAAPVLTLSPATPSPARSLTWAFTHEAGSTLICRLAFPTGAVREIAGCASPLTVDLTGLPDGSYTLTVRAVDAAGNVGAALTEVHVLDSAALAPPTVTGPATPGTSRTPRWTITAGSSAGTTECRLTRGTTVLRDWSACSGGFTADLFGQPDGTYVLSVRSKDATGAVSAAAQSRYLLDTTAPGAAVLVAPPTPSTNRRPTWTIASSEPGATAECRVLVFGSVLEDWAPCAVTAAGALHTVDLSGLGDGTYTLVVRLTDAAGNRSTVEASSSYVLDTSAPVAVGITGPPTPGNDVTPTWTLSSGSGAVLECRLTSAAGVVSDWAPCAGDYSADLTGLPDGIYTLAVRAVSAAGTPGPDTTSAYELSTAAPGAPTALALVSGLKPTSNNRSPAWTFTLPSGTTGHCRVVQGTRVVFDGPCSSPFRLDLSGAPDGSYTLTVRGISAAGTPGAAATSTYVLDTEPTAEPVFTQVPGASGSTLDPQWRFSLARGATAQCRLLYGGTPLDDWTACTSPFTAQLTGRPDGTYVLQVRAVDSAGNTSAPVSNAYVLDRTAAPVATFTDTPPATGSDRTVTWSFSAPDGTTLECRLVGPDGRATAWGACGTGAAAALRVATARALLAGGTYAADLTGRADGLYLLEVRAVEADGRRGSAASAGYRLDTRPPAVPAFSDVPETTGADPKPVWLWDVGTDEMVECRLVRVGGGALGDWQECAESQYVADLSRLGQGTYALEIRLTDAAGNVSPVQSAAYRYDTTPPAAAVLTSRPPLLGADRTVSWTFAPVDGRATCTVTRDRTLVREGACSGRYDLDLTGQPDGTYTLTVRVTDAAGNSGAPTSSTYTLRTLGLPGPVRVDPPPVRIEEPTLPSTSTPTGSGRGGTGVAATPRAEGSASGIRVPIQPAEDDVVRASQVGPSRAAPEAQKQEATAPKQAQPRPAEGNPLLPGPIPVEDVGAAVREIVTGTVAKPTLPLALLAIVILFLLAQNRIDRRDPKLAAAPVESEPELDFTTYVRRPGSAFS